MLSRCRGRSLALLAGVVALGALASPGRADAHAALDSSTPASGTTLDESPAQVVLDFDESVGLELGRLELFSTDGVSIPIGEAVHPGGRDDVVSADLPVLAPGVYVASYRVVSADGHPVSGDIVFRVGAGALDAGAFSRSGASSSTTVGLTAGLVRFLGSVALVLLLGTLAFVMVVWPGGWSRLARMASAGAVLVAVTSLAQFALAGPYLAGTGWSDAVDPGRWSDVWSTAGGQWFVARAVAAVVVAVAVRAAGERGNPVALAALGASAAVVVAGFVGDGHAVAGRAVLLGVVATAVHVAAMAAWLGGLGVLVWAAIARPDGCAEAIRERWTRLAATSVAALAVTGVVQAWRIADGIPGLGTTYGRLLWAKTAVVAAMVVLGDQGRRRLRRWTDEAEAGRALRRTVGVEVVLGVVVLAVTAILVQTSPRAARADADPVPAAAVTTVVTTIPSSAVPTTSVAPWTTELEQVGRRLTVSVDRAEVGTRTVEITLDDSAAPLSDPVTLRGRLFLDAKGLGPIPVTFTASSSRTWTTSAVEITESGTWRFELLVDDPSNSIRFSTEILVP